MASLRSSTCSASWPLYGMEGLLQTCCNEFGHSCVGILNGLLDKQSRACSAGFSSIPKSMHCALLLKRTCVCGNARVATQLQVFSINDCHVLRAEQRNVDGGDVDNGTQGRVLYACAWHSCPTDPRSLKASPGSFPSLLLPIDIELRFIP